MRKDIEAKLDQFECQRCNECCRQPGFVYLRNQEEERIAAHFQMEVRDFVDQYCELEDRRHLVLKKFPDETCIFLKTDGCQIHSVKPAQCHEFPRKWRTAASFSYCQGLKKLF